MRAPVRILLASTAIAFVTSGLIYLSGISKHNPLWWQSVLLPSLGIFTIWAIILRLLAVKWLRSQAQQTRWLILGAGTSAIKFVQNLLTLNPLGKLVVLAEVGQDTTQPYYEVRYLVKPGITGWAQVMYPYGASVEDAYEKLAYDLYYIKNYSFWLDIAIAYHS